MNMLGSRDRFKEAPWYNPEQKVTIGGLGSIGSWLTLFMGKLVNTIYVYDFDVVETHNMSGQFYRECDVNVTKQSAIKTQVMSYNPNTNIVLRGKFEEGSGVTPICFSAFDNMKARQNMFDSWKALDTEEKVFINASLTAEDLWVHAITPDRIEWFEENILLDDSEFDELPCSFKSTTHISSMCASHMVVAFTNWYSNREIDMRNLPYEINYNAAMATQQIKLTI